MSEKRRAEYDNWVKILGVNDDDVISNSKVLHRVAILRDELYKSVKNYAENLEYSLRPNNIPLSWSKWFVGDACEVLKVGAKGWQKGRVKLKLSFVLEFVPDSDENLEAEIPEDTENLGFSESRSPLDEIRQMDI